MKKWFCALVLVVFAVNVGLTGGGMANVSGKHAAASVESGSVSNAVTIVKKVSRCCMDKQVNGRSGTTRCSSDCSYSVTATQFLPAPAVQDHQDHTSGSERPRYAGTVFRPPIV